MRNKKIYALCATAGIIIGSLGVFPISAFEEQTDTNTTEITDTAEATVKTETAEMTDTTETTDVVIDSEPAGFTDVAETDWFYTYVSYLADSGIVKGVSESEFSPGGTFTVAEAAAIITRYLGLEQAAADRKNAMSILNIAGSDKWYAGYIQVMHEAGIIDVSKYGCTVYDRHIAIDKGDLLEAPIKRYEFISFVTRSFELEGTDIKKNAVTDVDSSSFIWGGAYDESLLERYIPLIKDYSSVPSEYNYYILKAYYNGIINGDDKGNFNPLNNLTRAEMAKVAAVIIDSSLRTRIDPPVRASYTLSSADYVQQKGNDYLKTSVSDAILLSEKNGIAIVYENNQPRISYKMYKDAPTGYSIDYYHYTKNSSGFDVDVKDAAAKSYEYDYINKYTAGDRFILAISDKYTGEVIDAYEFTLLDSGLLREDWCAYLP